MATRWMTKDELEVQRQAYEFAGQYGREQGQFARDYLRHLRKARRPAFYPRIVKHGPLWKASQAGCHALGTTPRQAYQNLEMYMTTLLGPRP